jgi:hypothetical protein
LKILTPFPSAPAGLLFAAALLAPAGCARSVNDYLAEARSGAPVAIKEAVIAIGGLLYQKDAAGVAFDEADREGLIYLKEVAAGSKVPINRAAALRALGRLRSAGAAEIALAALKDPFWLARLEAVKALEGAPEERFGAPLRDLLAREPHQEVRLEAVKALGKVKGRDALRALLEIFLDRTEGSRSPQVSAFIALRDMTGLGFTFDEVGKWGGYYEATFGARPPDRGLTGSPPIEPEKPAAPAPTGSGAPPPPAGGRPAPPPSRAGGPAPGATPPAPAPAPATPDPAGAAPAGEPGDAKKPADGSTTAPPDAGGASR